MAASPSQLARPPRSTPCVYRPDAASRPGWQTSGSITADPPRPPHSGGHILTSKFSLQEGEPGVGWGRTGASPDACPPRREAGPSISGVREERDGSQEDRGGEEGSAGAALLPAWPHAQRKRDTRCEAARMGLRVSGATYRPFWEPILHGVGGPGSQGSLEDF